MKNYRVRVTEEKMAFFEELMSYLDFCDYEGIEDTVESGAFGDVKHSKSGRKALSKDKIKPGPNVGDTESKFANLREVMAKIEALRDKDKK